jgi:pSer/pThr/pTyr-binding forkhead associated (FHA) protein
LRAGRNIIGRTADCDVCLEDGRVSAQHAFLFVRQEDASYIDVSSNGSKVEGRALQGEQVSLKHGAALELGGTRLVLLLVPEASLEKVGVR